jgi:hypothetical protein
MKFAALVCAASWLSAAASAQPVASPSPAPVPTVSPAPLPTPSLAPTPLPTPTILMLAPDAPPQILWTILSSTTPRAGDTISGTVLTSSNVASVELRVGGFGMNATKVDVGHFEWSFTVPKLPILSSHTFALEIIARNAAGVIARRSTTVKVR